jgi:thiol-disulfide isomerase/thioredoxin
MNRSIITEIEDRKQFHDILKNNNSFILKFGAEWCGPCKKIKTLFYDLVNTLPSDVLVGDIDVDHSFDIYAFLKSKKMVNGIPVILGYKRDNENYIPDASVTGTNINEINNFFETIKSWE